MSNKTRKWRSAIAMVLVICMLFSIFPVAAFAQDSANLGGGLVVAPEIKYVSLGDSMTNGYGLDGYNGNTGVEDYGNESYANQFADWLVGGVNDSQSANHAQLAMSAMRAEDLHWLLEVDYDDSKVTSLINAMEKAKNDGKDSKEVWNEYKDQWYSVFTNGDYWTWDELVNNYRFDVAAYCIEGKDEDESFSTDDAKNTYTDVKALEVVAKYYQEAVADADIISLGMGNGNFGVFMFGRIMEAIGFDGDPADAMIYDIDDALRECDPKVKAEIDKLLVEAENVLADYGILADSNEMMEALYNTFVYAVASYALNYAGSVEAILQLNSDAEIIQVALMNTIKTNTSIEGKVTLGDVMDGLIIPLNAYIAALPTVMQAAQNSVYAEAKFYYAEAPYVECIVDTYDDEDGLNDIVRDRFFKSIVKDGNETGMVWGLLGNLVTNDFALNDVKQYEIKKDAEKLAYAVAEDTEDKVLSIAMYLAFEKAIVAGKDNPVSIDSIMGVAGLFAEGADPFSSIMAEFTAAVPKYATEDMLNTVFNTAASIMSQQTNSQINPQINAESVKDAYTNENNTQHDTVKNVVEPLITLLVMPNALSDVVADSELSGLLSLFARCVIGNGIGSHPSAAGHQTLADAVINAYENEYTALDETLANLEEALEATKDFIVEYHPEMIAYAWQVADEEGYTAEAIQALKELDAMLVELASDLGVADAVNGIAPAAELSVDEEAYKEKIAEAIISARAAIAEAIKMLENEGSDDRTEAQLWAIIEKLEATLSDLYDILVLAAEDGAEYADEVIKEALTELDKAVQQAIADLKELAEEVANGVYDYIAKNAPGAIEALKNALYDLAVQTGDDIYWFLYDNPDKVVAFFNEYGDKIWAVVEAYGPDVIGGILYFVADNHEEIGAFLVEYYPEILEFTWMLIEEHGENAAKLINVYAEELGYCDAVRDVIADIEKEIADLKDQLENELKKQLEDLKAELEDLYEQLENASDEVKAQIQKAIEEVEKLIAEVEKAIAEIEAAIADLEAQLAEAQKALEEAIAAVEAVVEAIKEAIENGVETVEEILAVIEDVVEFAKDTIAGVQTAIDGIVNAVEDVVAFVDELIANGIIAAEMIEEIINTVMDIIDGVVEELEKGDIEAAIEEIRNQLTNGYEELQAMLAAIDTAIAEQLDAIVGDLEAALAQAQDEFEEALYNATHGEITCDAKIFAVGGNTATAAGGYADILVADERWNLTEAENIDGADVILYQADPQKFSKALKAGLVNAFAAVLEKELNPSMADFVLGQLELEKTDAPNWNAYITDENAMAYFEQAKADLVNELAAEYGEDVAELMSPVIDTVMYAVVGYAIENIATIESLSEANEDALIVAVGMYNPVQGMTVTIGGEEIDIEALCQYLIEVTDVYNLLYAIAAQNAVFVDVSEAETNAVGNVDVDKIIALDGDEFDNVLNVLAALDSNYANADGHAYIAAQILDAIDVVHDGGCPECEVKDIPVTGVTLNTTEATMTTGSSLQLVATVLPENATNKAVTWESDDEDLITVDENGLVTSYSTTGSAYIIVTTEDGNYTAECEVTVEEKPIDYVAVTGVTLDEEAITLIAAGETQTLTATVEPSDAADKSVIWTSSNPEVATVVNGVVTAVANGEAIITVTTANGGYTDTCSVTVNIPTGTETVSVTGVALDEDRLSLKVGNTAALTATVTPGDATNKAVTWESSDESIATVANGVVTAVAKGTATITVTTVDGGFTDTCAVTVTKASSGGFGGGGGGAYTKAKPEVIVPDNAVPAGVTVTADYADYQTVNGAQDFAAKDNNIAVIGGRDSSAEVIVKPAGAVDTFTHPVQLVVPVSKSALQNVDDVNKLTLALVTTDAQGNIQLTYVGGNYDASKGTFTAYVNQPGKYVLVEKLDLVKIELTIDRYVIFVNGEPIINDVPSRIVNNRTLAPAARVLHHMGCTVEWLSDTRTVAVTLPNGDVLNLPVDEPIPGFGAAPVIENDRTLVPIAYIADMMDAHVQWVGNDRKVIIVK